MCIYLYIDKNTLEEYCELLDKPCVESCLSICPLVNE